MLHKEISFYLDDALLQSTTFDQHLTTLEKFFHRLRQAKLMLGHKKCRFLQKSVDFLGHMISSEGIKPADDKIVAIQNYSQPKTVKQVKSFLGMCSFFRKFVKNFSLIAAPLYNLTKQDVKFAWTDECQLAFQTLKGNTTHPKITTTRLAISHLHRC